MSGTHGSVTYAHVDSAVHRLPAIYKLLATIGIVIVVAALPPERAAWSLAFLPLLVVVGRVARVPLRVLVARLALVQLFILGTASLALFQRRGLDVFVALILRSTVAVFAVQMLAHTTPFSDLLSVMKRLRVPLLIRSTVALLHRYLDLIVEESRRMQRARACRTFATRRLDLWRSLGTVIGLLFVRSVSRAERVHAAMRSRGWS